MATARQETNRAEAELNTPEARAEARDSRDDFDSLGRLQAREVLQEHQPDIVREPGWPRPDLESGQHLELLGPMSAAVVDADGKDALVSSTVPMAYRDESGDLRAIDLSLASTDEGLEPRESPVPVVLPETAAEPVVVGDGSEALRIAPAGAPDAQVTKTDKGAFYANVAADTDMFVKPIVGGAESFHVLRSAASPETLAIHLGLPDGAVLRDTPDRGQAVVKDERVLASISRVVARDDAGRAVPVTTTVNGDGLVLRVDHRSGTYNYPIVVDPSYYDYVGECWYWVTQSSAACQFDDWEQSSNSGYGNNIAGWTFFNNDTDGMNRYGEHYEGYAYLGAGLYFKNSRYNYFRSAPGDKGGQYWFTAPPSVRIFRAAFANLSTDNLDSNPTCAYVGLLNTASNGAAIWFPWSPHSIGNCAKQTLNETFWACDVNCRNTAGTPGNSAIFGVIGQDRWGDYYMHHMGTAVLYMTDDNAPGVRAVYPPTEPITDPSKAITFNWGDDGVGVKRLTFKLDNASWNAPTTAGGSANYYCANGSGGVTTYQCEHNAWVDIRVGDLSPGTHTIRADIIDVVGRTSSTSVTFQVRSPFVDSPTDQAALTAAHDPADSTIVAGDAFGERDTSTACVADAQVGGYCGQSDVSSATQRFYNEPPIAQPASGSPSGLASASAASSDGNVIYWLPDYGLAEQHLESIYNNSNYRSWFQALGTHKVRRAVPWDIVDRADEHGAWKCGPRNSATVDDLTILDSWVAAARALNQEIILSFERSRAPGAGQCLPTVAEYAAATDKVIARYPDIDIFSSWNEPNNTDYQPTAAGPNGWTGDAKRAGQYWRSLETRCQQRCLALAGEFLDAKFTKAYLTAYKQGMGHNSDNIVWAWHSYKDTKLRDASTLRAFLNATKTTQRVWLTEQGPVLQKGTTDPTGTQQATITGRLSNEVAGDRLRWLLDDLPLASVRLRRLYVYQWVGETYPLIWDSGLIERTDGSPRNLYTIFKNRTNP